jgi:tripartite-type tricarboxylate transporter receptor subunit TctC
MFKKACILILVALSCGGILTQYAQGKEYPTRPVEILVPYSPGTSADITFRLIADMAPKYLGQPVVVVNKPGAGGSLAAAEIIAFKPDGYKLMATTNVFFTITTKTQKIPFDPNFLIPLANFVEYKDGMFVKADSPWKTLSDLLDYGKKNPRKLRWAHSSRGHVQHMFGMLIFRKAGVETVDVPYPGGPEMVTGVLGGHLDAGVASYAGLKGHVMAGKIRYLVLNRDRRYSDPSDVPCAAELGFPEMAKLIAYGGLYCHKDTPEEIKKSLIGAFKKVYEEPEFRKKFEELGNELRFEGPEFVKEAIKKGEEITVPILKELGLYVER